MPIVIEIACTEISINRVDSCSSIDTKSTLYDTSYLYQIIATSCIDRITPTTCFNHIIALGSADQIISTTAINSVVSLKTVNHIITGRAIDNVVTIICEEIRILVRTMEFNLSLIRGMRYPKITCCSIQITNFLHLLL